MKKIAALLVGLVLMLMATTAMAITVDINGTDYTTAATNQVYDFIHKSNNSWDGGNNKINIVDYILNGRLNGGNHIYTLVNGTSNLNPTDTWFANGAVSIMIEEIAGYASTNTFGYYTDNPTTRTQLFQGSDSGGASSSFTLSSANTFGFYLGVPQSNNSFYYTEANLNTNNEIHAAIFQVDNSNTYILGFEDLRLTNTDADYQDMIVRVTINNPVPEPSTILLLGAGIGGLAIWRRKKSA